MDKIIVFDTTLRDGAQAKNISFSNKNKIDIFRIINDFNLDYVELGSPSFNDNDYELFRELSKTKSHSKLVAFTRTSKQNNIENEFSKIVECGAKTVAIVGKSSLFHVEKILNVSPQTNLEMIRNSIAYLKDRGLDVIFDAEHFFDAFLENSTYAIETIKCAVDSGASNVTLCDTNGGMLPEDIYSITKTVVDMFGLKVIVGIHCHNDMGLATINTIKAVEAGAKCIQGTFLGIGERCGNANLSTIIPILQLKLGHSIIDEQIISNLTAASYKMARICGNLNIDSFPFVGCNAFSHKAGMHIDGVLKNSKSFEHVDPSLIGNDRSLAISNMSGTKTIDYYAKTKFNFVFDEDSVKAILIEIKEKEALGYDFQRGDASLDIIFIKRILDKRFSSFCNVDFVNDIDLMKKKMTYKTHSIDVVELDVDYVGLSGNQIRCFFRFDYLDKIHTSIGISTNIVSALGYAVQIAFEYIINFEKLDGDNM